MSHALIRIVTFIKKMRLYVGLLTYVNKYNKIQKLR